MESQLPEEDLIDPDETVLQENPSAEDQNEDRPSTPIQDVGEPVDPSNPGVLSSFVSSFAGFTSSEKTPVRDEQATPQIESPVLEDPTTPKQDDVPSSPFSLMGSWFGRSPVSPSPPALEPVIEPPAQQTPTQPETEGIGGFFSSLFSGDEKDEEEVKTLPVPAEPQQGEDSSYRAKPPGRPAALQFDNTDAEETVRRIENGIDPRSKRLQRLLVANEAEAQLRLFETEAAMRKLRTIQSETNAIVQQAATAKAESKLPPATADPVSKASTEALKKAKAVLRAAHSLTAHPIKGSKGSSTKREGVQPWRANHPFEPIAAPSSRLMGFPQSELGPHPSRPFPSSAMARSSIVVAAVETRPVFRSMN